MAVGGDGWYGSDPFFGEDPFFDDDPILAEAAEAWDLGLPSPGERRARQAKPRRSARPATAAASDRPRRRWWRRRRG